MEVRFGVRGLASAPLAEWSGHATQEPSCGCREPVGKDVGAEPVVPVVEETVFVMHVREERVKHSLWICYL